MPHQALLQSNHCRKKLRQSLIRTAGFGESHRKGDEEMVKIHEKMVAFLSAVCEEQGTKHGCHCCQGADSHRKVLNKNPRDSPRCAEKCCRCAECTTFFFWVLLVVDSGTRIIKKCVSDGVCRRSWKLYCSNMGSFRNLVSWNQYDFIAKICGFL